MRIALIPNGVHKKVQRASKALWTLSGFFIQFNNSITQKITQKDTEAPTVHESDPSAS